MPGICSKAQYTQRNTLQSLRFLVSLGATGDWTRSPESAERQRIGSGQTTSWLPAGHWSHLGICYNSAPATRSCPGA